MICKKCNREDVEFYISNKTRCKECVKEAARVYRDENLEHVRAYDRVRGLSEARKKKVAERAHLYAKAPWIGKWRKENPIKRRAHNLVNNAVRDGKITKPDKCECGRSPVHGHHEDYSKPLQVEWLCAACHGKRHRELRWGTDGQEKAPSNFTAH